MQLAPGHPFGNTFHDEFQTDDAIGTRDTETEIAQSESGTIGHAIAMRYDLAGNLTSLTYPDGRSITDA